LLLLDTSVIIDGRIAELIETNFLEGIVVVPRFVLRELQQIADSSDPVKRARGRRGLEMLNRLRRNPRNEVKIHDGDFPEEPGVDAKLLRLARNLGAKLFTNDYNLARVAELQNIPCVNINDLARALKPVVLPGEVLTLRVAREGREKGQGVGYLPDGTMVVINHAQPYVGQQVEVQVQSLLQSATGTMVFADLRAPAPAST
ncbi:MAG: TRAM domain-containing protein, partial [Verrucomicrobiales bacterium]|nr:TRAM domain-containing protein [Verrucomicrobiales bacterium]